jgi:hypothetical protein
MLSELTGTIKDKVPSYDIRRLYNLRKYLLQIEGSRTCNEILVERTPMVSAKVDKILGDSYHGLPRKLILDFIVLPDKNFLSIDKLNQVITSFEDSKF